jgi:hypothetical protein
MLQEVSGFMGDTRLTGRQSPPSLKVTADLVDERVRRRLHDKIEATLPRLFRLRSRNEVFAAPAASLDFLR